MPANGTGKFDCKHVSLKHDSPFSRWHVSIMKLNHLVVPFDISILKDFFLHEYFLKGEIYLKKSPVLLFADTLMSLARI